MIPSLEIKNFRTFDYLKIDKLAQVNLITGKNNVGKTSLLEAIALLKYEGRLNVIQEFADINGYSQFIEHVFHGYILSKDKEPEVIISTNLSSNNKLRIIFLCDDENKDSTNGIGIQTSQVKNKYNILEIENELESNLSFSSSIKCYYVPPSGLNLKIFKDWWNHLCLSTFEDDVINGLKLIIPDIQRIGLKEEYVKFVDEIQRKLSSILKAKIEGLDFAVPLESFGGGVLRDFGIILSLVKSKDGVLLIDEFENGLHYSVQPEIWKLILTLAKRLNVQVFATTHSWDCIEAFKEATGECKEDISCQLIRLSKKNGKFLSTIIDADELPVVTRQKIEVR